LRGRLQILLGLYNKSLVLSNISPETHDITIKNLPLKGLKMNAKTVEVLKTVAKRA